MSKYEFNEELKAYENQNMSIIPVVVPVLQFLMSFLYNLAYCFCLQLVMFVVLSLCHLQLM